MSKTRATLDAQDRRVKFGLVAITVTILLLISASYAWFVGNQNVSINPFEINIAASESLELSLNGYQWAAELTLTEKAILGIESEENLFVPDPDDEDPNRRLDTIMNAYAGNKNNWPEKGLVPISTNGQMDINASRMILFEKTSLITTSGGYRVVANRIKNNLRTEEIGRASCRERV